MTTLSISELEQLSAGEDWCKVAMASLALMGAGFVGFDDIAAIALLYCMGGW